MNGFLANYFGTNASPEQVEEQQKQAESEMFVNLAKEAGVDLNQMTDSQINELYAQVMGKYAESDDDDNEDEKKRRAAAEYESKKESHVKFAEATEMGQIMAHSFWNELGEIEKKAGPRLDAVGAKIKELTGKAGKGWDEYVKAIKGESIAKNQLSTIKNEMGRYPTPTLRDRARVLAGSKGGRQAAALAGTAVPVAGAGVAGGYALSGSKKESSALNELAFELAVAKCAQVGWGADEAATRIASVINLALVDEDNTKIAYAHNVDHAVDIRSLELIEAAGYPVNWE